jgi:hypothetical protein
MLADLRHIELAKPALTHLCVTLHTKLVWVPAEFWLMPFARIIRAPIWVALMRRAAQKKAQQLHFG